MDSLESFYCILAIRYHGVERNIGVLLYQSAVPRLSIRCLDEYPFISDIEDAEILAALANDLILKAAALQIPLQLIEQMEDTLSNTLLISPRLRLPAHSDDLLDQLFRVHVKEQELLGIDVERPSNK